MRKQLLFWACAIVTCSVEAQIPYFDPIDTVETNSGTMLIYANRTWAYLDEEKFDGVMNDYLHDIFCEDSAYRFETDWDIDKTIISTTNAVDEMKDTVWVCVLDSLHGSFCVPRKDRVTSRYGYRHGRNHNGIDIDLETGDTIYAAFDGKVRYSQYHDNGFGNLVIIRHYNGLETYYGHCSVLMVAPNQEVKAGQPIALGGNTGHSTGSHLHFEVRFYDNPLNPEEIFDFDTGEIRYNLLVHRALFRPGRSGSYSYTVADKNASTHKVRSGDTLGKIARIYGTSVGELCRLNTMSETDILNIGQVLRVK